MVMGHENLPPAVKSVANFIFKNNVVIYWPKKLDN